MKKRIFLRWLILFAIVFSLAFAWKEYNRKQVNTNEIEAITPKSSSQVIEEFVQNEQAAGAKYNNKALVFTGTIKTMVLNDSIQNLTIGSTINESGVICEFEDEQYDVLKKLKIGDSVKVKGICTGYLMDIIMVRCVLVK